MGNNSGIPTTEKRPMVVGGIVAPVGTIAVLIVVQAVILFLAAGRLNWAWARVYQEICLVSAAVMGALALRPNPETIAERGRPQATQDWDWVVGGPWALLPYDVPALVAGLDVRLSWTRETSAAWNVAGAVLVAVGLGSADGR